MRIERIHIDAFGRLADFDTGGERLGDLVVVLGPNEAGKSTLFSFLTTALYGFLPASRERNPHVPWGLDEAAGRIEVTLRAGACAQIERRLRSSPSARLTESGVTRELRNHPVPWAEHVPRGVFRQVFAITLADLARLDIDTWGRVQERLVGSMGSSDLASARDVADALEREASELWRPNRRGNQRIRDLQAAVRSLRARRAAALERDARIRQLLEERENAQVRLREIRAERQRHRVAVERVQSLAPIRKRLARITSLRSQGGDLEELRGLPQDPPARLAGLVSERRELEDRVAALEQDLEAPEAALGRYDEGVRLVLERGDDIARLVAGAAEAAPERRRAERAGAALEEIRGELATARERLFGSASSEALDGPVGDLPLELLEDRIRRIRAAEAAAARPGRARAGSAPPGWLAPASLLASVAGASLLAWGSTGGPTATLAPGAALLTAGLLGGLRAWRARSRTGAESPAPSPADEGARARRELAEMLSGLPLRPERLERPEEGLVGALRAVQELDAARRAHEETLRSAREALRGAETLAAGVCAALGRTAEGAPGELAVRLDRELREAERIREAAHSAERESDRLRRELDVRRRELDGLRGRISSLGAALSGLGDGDPARGARVAADRIAAHRRAEELTDELERGHGDLADLEERIRASESAGDGWGMDDESLARARAHVEELDAQVEGLIAEGEALERDAEHLRGMETVDAVDGESASLRETEAGLVRERDRKWVLAQLVREADRRFREEHQPDLVRRASAHLAHLTGGRYDRLLVDETDGGGLFRIMGPGLPAPVPLEPPVSTGTLEQAYLGLRLAIVDHLDEGRERLPLFIDEALVNWDRTRRERGLDALADLAATRQLFVFTCHHDIAESLKARGARVLRLEDGA